MICPKCGRNNEGISCPYCDGPEIRNTTGDWQRRKREFERKNKANEANDVSSELPDSEKVNDETEKPEGLSEKKESSFPVLKKIWKPVCIVAAAAASSAIIFTHLPVDYKRAAYYYSGNEVYLLKKGEGEYIAKASELAFTSDRKYFYKFNADTWDSTTTGLSDISTVMCDKTGNYFAYSGYDNADGKYKIFCKKDGGEVVKLFEGEGQLTVREVTEDGGVYFTSVGVISDEWGLADTTLMYSAIESSPKNEDTKVFKKNLERDVRWVRSLVQAGGLVLLTGDGRLVCVDTDVSRTAYKIADNVSSVLFEESGQNDYFNAKAQDGGSDPENNRIIYYSDKQWKMINIADGMDEINLGYDAEYYREWIFYEKDRIVYRISNDGISRSVIGDNGMTEFEQIQGANPTHITDVCWDAHKGILIYEDENGNIAAVGTGFFRELGTAADAKSLKKVKSDSGYIYTRDGFIFYGKDFKSEAVKKAKLLSDSVIDEAVMSGNKIFFVQDSRLFSLDIKSGEISDVATCEGIYVV